MSKGNREYSIVIWGASGFTGKLTAEYILGRYGVSDRFSWALGGRNPAKLEKVRKEISETTGVAADALPLVVGDSDDDGFLTDLANRTDVVCTTVGPYAKYGSKLVAACARAGTDYCDLTGEVQWMKRMIDAHHEEAVQNNARIVFTCGFDCIPSDIGAFFLHEEMRKKHGVPCSHIQFRVNGFSGAASGGTVASMLNMMEEAKEDSSILSTLRAPYSINPPGQKSGPDSAESVRPSYDDDFDQWIAPFVMGAVNTKVVRRSNALLNYAYGEGFRYDEAVLCGRGPAGFAKATATGLGSAIGMGAMAVGPIRRFAAGRLPQPGEGPSLEKREAGFFDVSLLGHHPSDPSQNLKGRIRGDRDPGYGSTSKMLGESAVCLAVDELASGGGCLTPASAMGGALLSRLPAHAGVSFDLEG
ncbi:MAG: saccharopine dehydrogenase NADP-binding domain-containing protein [Myxococcota bacterium]|nr:saccharopine dehydrogenase NADP-binding domain-containing protein [Myxococcota bacterium]